MTLSDRDALIYAALGFSVWLSGALEFRWFGHALFESGAWISLATALFVAIAVCFVFRATMRWRKTSPTQAVMVAVLMAAPGLFGETARELAFGWATGLHMPTQGPFAATIFFGNAVLLTYAVFVQRSAR